MSLRISAWSLIAAATLSGCAVIEPPRLRDRDTLEKVRRVAVLPFTGGPDYKGARPGDALAGAVTDQLPKAWQRIEVIERSEIDKVLDQSKLEAVGLTEAAGTRELGEKLGVQAVVLGDTIQYMQAGKISTVGAAIRVIDVKTGRVVYANVASVSSDQSISAANRALVAELIRPLVEGLKAPKPGEAAKP
jgi:curli biogenesis system outer membrane secretion channel CsgG